MSLRRQAGIASLGMLTLLVALALAFFQVALGWSAIAGKEVEGMVAARRVSVSPAPAEQIAMPVAQEIFISKATVKPKPCVPLFDCLDLLIIQFNGEVSVNARLVSAILFGSINDRVVNLRGFDVGRWFWQNLSDLPSAGKINWKCGSSSVVRAIEISHPRISSRQSVINATAVSFIFDYWRIHRHQVRRNDAQNREFNTYRSFRTERCGIRGLSGDAQRLLGVFDAGGSRVSGIAPKSVGEIGEDSGNNRKSDSAPRKPPIKRRLLVALIFVVAGFLWSDLGRKYFYNGWRGSSPVLNYGGLLLILFGVGLILLNALPATWDWWI